MELEVRVIRMMCPCPPALYRATYTFLFIDLTIQTYLLSWNRTAQTGKDAGLIDRSLSCNKHPRHQTGGGVRVARVGGGWRYRSTGIDPDQCHPTRSLPGLGISMPLALPDTGSGTWVYPCTQYGANVLLGTRGGLPCMRRSK